MLKSKVFSNHLKVRAQISGAILVQLMFKCRSRHSLYRLLYFRSISLGRQKAATLIELVMTHGCIKFYPLLP